MAIRAPDGAKKNSFASMLYILTTIGAPEKLFAQVKPPPAVYQASTAWVFKEDLEKE